MYKNVIVFVLISVLATAFITGCGKKSDKDFTNTIKVNSSKDRTAGNEADDASFGRKKEGGELENQKFEGRYDILGLYLDDNYVKDEMFAGWYLELDEDGEGYMYFGENNQGDISEWSMNGDNLVLKSGVSVFEGKSTIKDGVLLLDFDNDMVVAFASESADRSKIKVLSSDEYMKLSGK